MSKQGIYERKDVLETLPKPCSGAAGPQARVLATSRKMRSIPSDPARDRVLIELSATTHQGRITYRFK